MSDWVRNCYRCNSKIKIDGDDLPDLACDTAEIECEHCGKLHAVNWYAEIEFGEVSND